ncbi:MAG: condensation domain-containing protein [Mycobacteriales bacterium]
MSTRTPSSAPTTGLSAAQRALLAQRLGGRAPGTVAGIPAAPPGPVPVSAEQEQLIYHTFFVPENPLYNECITLVHKGSLDADALRAAVDGLVARHAVWHSTFRRSRGRFEQTVAPAPTHALPVHDLRGVTGDARTRRLHDIVAGAALEPYDLRVGPLVRPVLVRMADDEHRLYLAMHHVVFDGVSLYRIVLPEIIALYEAAAAGRPHGLPEPFQYRDYAAWQAGGGLDRELAEHLPYWREHLDGAPTLALPLDHERPDPPRFRGRTEWFPVPAELVARLKHSSGRHGVTLFHLLATVWALVLADISGQTDVVFATVADRRRRRELEHMVGYCLTPVPLRVRTDVPVADLMAAVRLEMLEALTHLVPFGRLVGDLDPAHPPGATPVFQSMIVLEPPAATVHPEWSMHQMDAAVGGEMGHPKVDLLVELDERPEGHLSGRLIVNADVFDPPFGPSVVARLLRALAVVAQA